MSDQLKAFDKVLADLAEIQNKGNFLPDCATKEGYEASKEYVLKVTTPARTALTSAHKQAKAFYLEGGRAVDAKKNEVMEILEAAQKPHQEAYKSVDEERKRIKAAKEAAIQNGFNTLNGYIESAFNQSSSVIQELIDDCGCFDADQSVYGKETPAIIDLQSKVIGKLTDAMSTALQFEEMQLKADELAKQQAAIEEHQRKIAEQEAAQQREIEQAEMRERMRQEAEQEAAAETDRLKKEAEQSELRRIEQEKQAVIDAENAKAYAHQQSELAAKQAVEQEQKRQEQARIADQESAAKLEADKKHSRTIKTQAFDCFVQGGLDESSAKLAVKLIASRKIANIQINYQE